jgi:hypothetical protein
MTYIRNRAIDYFLEVSSGNITGHSAVHKFGSNSLISASSTEDVWDGGGTYEFPSTALMTSISQTTDQSAMRSSIIEIQGLDINWDVVMQNATLDASNTTTVVTLTTPLIRVFKMKVLADVVNDANIRIHNAGETVDYAVIQAGNNETLMSIYTVPNNHTAYMTKYYADVVESTGKEPKSVVFRLWTADRENGYTFQLKNAKTVSNGMSAVTMDYKPYFKIPQKTDIKISASVAIEYPLAPDPSASGEDASVHAGFDIILVANE